MKPGCDKDSSVIVLRMVASPIARERCMMMSIQNTKQRDNHHQEWPDHLVLLLGQDGPSIERVRSLLMSDTTPPSFSRQCAWCGKITHGSLSGFTLLQCQSHELRPYLHPGFSHGICRSCIDKYMPRRHHKHNTMDGSMNTHAHRERITLTRNSNSTSRVLHVGS